MVWKLSELIHRKICNDKRIKICANYIFNLNIFFLTIKYYLSDEHKKKYYRTVNEINNNLSIDDQNIPILKNDTQDIITYVDDKNEKTKPFSFWKLLNE